MTTSHVVRSLLPNDEAVCTQGTTLGLQFRCWDLSSGFHSSWTGFPVEYSVHFPLQSFNYLLFTFTDYSIQWAFKVKCLLLFCFLKTIIHKYLEHAFNISGFLCYFFFNQNKLKMNSWRILFLALSRICLHQFTDGWHLSSLFGLW